MQTSFSKLGINLTNNFKQRHKELFSNGSSSRKHFDDIFKRPKEIESKIQGVSEKPTWLPHEAYMFFLEWFWEPIEKHLISLNLSLEKKWRNNFADSRDYKDYEFEHRRIFFGQLVDTKKEHPVTSFMLTAAHDHKKFNWPAPPIIQIAPEITTGAILK